jgi:hypothetical protein
MHKALTSIPSIVGKRGRRRSRRAEKITSDHLGKNS